mgnify:CR=1 FL=1
MYCNNEIMQCHLTHISFFYSKRDNIIIPDFRYLLYFVKNWFSICIFSWILYGMVQSTKPSQQLRMVNIYGLIQYHPGSNSILARNLCVVINQSRAVKPWSFFPGCGSAVEIDRIRLGGIWTRTRLYIPDPDWTKLKTREKDPDPQHCLLHAAAAWSKK